jgi:hypothetical protein
MQARMRIALPHINSTHQILNAAIAGLGLAYAPEDMVQAYLATGRLVRVLEDWCEPYSGYHLYPSRRQLSPAFALLVDSLRYSAQSARAGSSPTRLSNQRASLPAANPRDRLQDGELGVRFKQLAVGGLLQVERSGCHSRTSGASRRSIAQRKLTTAGEPVWACHNPPMTPWFLRRNEILIEVRPAL